MPLTPSSAGAWRPVLGAFFFKLLLIASYRSTDFDVHRNWLSITKSLPLKLWYVDKTNPWTLDYPPFFAYFERLLASAAPLFDKGMLRVTRDMYDSWPTVLFQRLTVLASELVLAGGLMAFSRWATPAAPQGGKGQLSTAFRLVVRVFLSPAFIMIDHMHFQYNGFLFGVLVWSIACLGRGIGLSDTDVRSMPWVYLGAVLFAALLHLKHLFIFCGPAVFIWLLRTCCWRPGSRLGGKGVVRFSGLGTVVIAVTSLSLGPFAAQGVLRDVLRRLFPFQRGLCHAYWAPNVWALYAAADRTLRAALRVIPSSMQRSGASALSTMAGAAPFLKTLRGSPAIRTVLGILIKQPGSNRSTGHAGGDPAGGFEFHSLGGCPLHLLPEPAAPACLLLSLAAAIPSLALLWRRPSLHNFLLALTCGNLGAFLFGYHVHEKAALNFLVPLLLLREALGSSPSQAQATPEGKPGRLAAGGGRGRAGGQGGNGCPADTPSTLIGPLYSGLLPAADLIAVLVYVSLTPLLHELREVPIKIVLVALHAVVTLKGVDAWLAMGSDTATQQDEDRGAEEPGRGEGRLASSLRLLGLGTVPLLLFTEVIHPLLLLPRVGLEFLPLLALSVYVGFGLVLVYVWLTKRVLSM